MNISVIVPTYNRADLIAETLESILAQNYPPTEIIVVDDGSTDNTEQIVRKYAPAVSYLRIKNSGECAARNAGVAHCSGDWVGFCDSDDLWAPDKLRLHVQLFKTAPDVEYSFSNFRTVVGGAWSQDTKFDTSPPAYWHLPRRNITSDLFVIECSMFARLLTHQPIFPSTLMMKKSFFDAVGRWNEPLGRTRSVDLEFHLRCVAKGPIGVVAAPVVGIRKHAANFSGDPLVNALGEIEVLRYVLQHNPIALKAKGIIVDEIARRTAKAAEQSFDIGNLRGCRELMKSVPVRQRSRRQILKAAIASLPPYAAHGLRHTAQVLARNWRLRYDHS
jgi:glycosyltransferase involved in cell wall biosynthesis